MKINWDSLEGKLDRNLSRVLVHPLFLQSVSALLNVNSHRKIWMDQTMLRLWKAFQLPNKRDQERTLHLLNELRQRIHDLESKMDVSGDPEKRPRPLKGGSAGLAGSRASRVPSRTKAGAAKAEPESLSIQ